MGSVTPLRLEAPTEEEGPTRTAAPTTATVVWVDGSHAIVARWAGGPIVERLESDVPSHHRSTGHVRHDPTVRHGGGGAVSDQVERDRLRHRAAHLRRVARLVPATGDVMLLGPGQARLELERAIAAADRRRGHPRPIGSQASGRLTERELVARLRAAVGEAPARRTVGRG